jgi:hypothetical protein
MLNLREISPDLGDAPSAQSSLGDELAILYPTAFPGLKRGCHFR